MNMLKSIKPAPKSPQPPLTRRNSSGSTSSRRTDQPGRLAKLDLLESPGELQGIPSKDRPAHLQRVERWRDSSVPLMILPSRHPEVRSSPAHHTRFQTVEFETDTSDSENPMASSGRFAIMQRTASPHRPPTSDMDGQGDSDARMRYQSSPFARSRTAPEAYERPGDGVSPNRRFTHDPASHGVNGCTQLIPRSSQVPRTATQRPHLSIIIPD